MSSRTICTTIGDQQLTATLDDNSIADAILEQLPLTSPTEDAYSRELMHRFPDTPPANEATSSGYEVGDIAYWMPRHSFLVTFERIVS